MCFPVIARYTEIWLRLTLGVKTNATSVAGFYIREGCGCHSFLINQAAAFCGVACSMLGMATDGREPNTLWDLNIVLVIYCLCFCSFRYKHYICKEKVIAPIVSWVAFVRRLLHCIPESQNGSSNLLDAKWLEENIYSSNFVRIKRINWGFTWLRMSKWIDVKISNTWIKVSKPWCGQIKYKHPSSDPMDLGYD
jgi:hypothetical protein